MLKEKEVDAATNFKSNLHLIMINSALSLRQAKAIHKKIINAIIYCRTIPIVCNRCGANVKQVAYLCVSKTKYLCK